jgi:hypothetical protein
MLTTDYTFGGSVTLQFELDDVMKEIKATLSNIEWVLEVGNKV